MSVLVLDCGSSTVKFQLIATDLDAISKNEDRRLARGGIERVGGEAIITLKTEGREQQRLTESLRDMRAAVDFIIRWATSERAGITGIHSIADIHAVGHRVVHGGERFTQFLISFIAGSPLWISRHAASLRRLSLSADPQPHSRTDQHHHASPGQRIFGGGYSSG